MVKIVDHGSAKPGSRMWKRGWTINVATGKPPEKPEEKPAEKPPKKEE